MDAKQFEDFKSILDMIPEDELSPNHEDYYEDEDNRVLSKKQIKQVKKAAEFLNSLASELSLLDYKVLREFSEYIDDSRFWSSSSFSC